MLEEEDDDGQIVETFLPSSLTTSSSARYQTLKNSLDSTGTGVVFYISHTHILLFL